MTEIAEAPGQDQPLRRSILWLSERLLAGESTSCPCCGQFAKVYKRKITTAMARVLIEMYRRGGEHRDWVSLPTICNDLRIGSRGDQSATTRWRLIERRPGQRDDGAKSTGWYRLTPLGVDFVRGVAKVPKYVRVYDNRVLETLGTQVSIRNALGVRFDYSDLMAGR